MNCVVHEHSLKMPGMAIARPKMLVTHAPAALPLVVSASIVLHRFVLHRLLWHCCCDRPKAEVCILYYSCVLLSIYCMLGCACLFAFYLLASAVCSLFFWRDLSAERIAILPNESFLSLSLARHSSVRRARTDHTAPTHSCNLEPCLHTLVAPVTVTIRYDFTISLRFRHYSDPFHPTKFRPCVLFICIYWEKNLVGWNGLVKKSRQPVKNCYDFVTISNFYDFVMISLRFVTTLNVPTRSSFTYVFCLVRIVQCEAAWRTFLHSLSFSRSAVFCSILILTNPTSLSTPTHSLDASQLLLHFPLIPRVLHVGACWCLKS